MQIVHLSEVERAEWEALYRAYATFYKVPMTAEILETVWGWIFDAQEAFFAIVAKNEQGQAVGFMHFREMPSPLRGRKVGFLDDLFVSPEFRGTGAVEALFARLEEEAAQRGWPLVRWITADDNYRGRGAYDKLATRTMWITYQMDL